MIGWVGGGVREWVGRWLGEWWWVEGWVSGCSGKLIEKKGHNLVCIASCLENGLILQ